MAISQVIAVPMQTEYLSSTDLISTGLPNSDERTARLFTPVCGFYLINDLRLRNEVRRLGAGNERPYERHRLTIKVHYRRAFKL